MLSSSIFVLIWTSESVPRQILLLGGLLVISGAARGTRVLQFDKRSGAYHTSFNHQRSIDKEPDSNAKKCMQTKQRDDIQRSKAFPREIPVRGRFFFERRFQPLSVGGCFSNQQESISRYPKTQGKSMFPSKTQNRARSQLPTASGCHQ